MLLGFKDQFVPFVEDGSKRQTIRGLRGDGRLFQVGDRCDLYANVRQPSMRLIGRHPCTKVERITIRLDERANPNLLQIFVDERHLYENEATYFAGLDGFRSTAVHSAIGAMAHFWIAEHRLSLGNPFHGQLIHWNPAVDLPGPHERRPARKHAFQGKQVVK